MSKQFDVRREVVLEATPEQVWRAVATGEGQGGWLWPSAEPGDVREAGQGDESGTTAAPPTTTVTAREEPNHFAVRTDGQDGWFNALEFLIEARGGGTAVLRYVHSGIITDDWDTQYDAVGKHTDFYLHTLGQYVRYFPDRIASYVSVTGPDASVSPAALGTIRDTLGLSDAAAPGDEVNVQVPGLEPLEAVVDYGDEHFLGLRSDDALYRFFARGTWGGPVELTVHHFGRSDPATTEKAWKGWLDGLLGQAS